MYVVMCISWVDIACCVKSHGLLIHRVKEKKCNCRRVYLPACERAKKGEEDLIHCVIPGNGAVAACLHDVKRVDNEPPWVLLSVCRAVIEPSIHKAPVFGCQNYGVDLRIVATNGLGHLHIDVEIQAV